MRILRTPQGGLFLVGMAVALAVVALALGAFGPLAPIARADLPSGAGCPAAAGTGTVPYEVVATLPAGAGQNANGVCINCTGPGGANNGAQLRQNAAGCGATKPTVGAGSAQVWADWGTPLTHSCVAPGDTVKILFSGGSTLPAVATVKWNLADNTVIDGTATIASYVGGVAELPALAGASDVGATTGGSGWSAGGWAALAGGLAAAFGLAGGGWYARRRWLK